MSLFDNFLSFYLALAGGFALVGGAWLFATRARLWWGGERALSEVVAYTPRMRARRGEKPIYVPRIRFRTADGAEREFQSRTSASPRNGPSARACP